MEKLIEYLTGPLMNDIFLGFESAFLTLFKVLFAFGLAYIAAGQRLEAKSKKTFYVKCLLAAILIGAVLSTSRPDQDGNYQENEPKAAREANSIWAKQSGMALAIIIFGSQFFATLSAGYEESKRNILKKTNSAS